MAHARILSTALTAALLGLVGTTADAGATVTFDLIWASTSGAGPGVGTNTITAAVGDTVTLELRMTNDEQLYGHAVSVDFDTDLGDELNLIGAGSWSGVAFGTVTMATYYGVITSTSPISVVESTTANGGRLNSYNSRALSGPLNLPTGSYTIGTAAFRVNTLSADGPDLFVGLFNSLDDVLDPEGVRVALVFNSATVNVPEPGTLTLLGPSLVGLVLAARRNRRRQSGIY